MPKLIIGNLPHAASAHDLQRWVESRGFRVESTEIIYDRATGQSRGFGFVTISDTEESKAATSVLNGRRMEGRTLTVNETTPLSAESSPTPPDRKPAAMQDPT